MSLRMLCLWGKRMGARGEGTHARGGGGGGGGNLSDLAMLHGKAVRAPRSAPATMLRDFRTNRAVICRKSSIRSRLSTLVHAQLRAQNAPSSKCGQLMRGAAHQCCVVSSV